MSEPTTPQGQPGSLLLLAFSSRPKVRVLNYLEVLEEQGVQVDLVVWDAERWRTTELEPPLPASVRLHELRPGERRLPTQRVKRLFMYAAPTRVLNAARRVVNSNPVTRPITPAVDFSLKAHKHVASIAEHRVFGVYNRFARPKRLAKVAGRVVTTDVNMRRVSRVVASEPYAVAYAWRMARRTPGLHVTVHLDRSPLPPAAS